MPQTATIVAVTLGAGKTVLATLTPDPADVKFSYIIDRTPALGLNATAGPDIYAFTMGADYSPDGGVTWGLLAEMTCAGSDASPAPASGFVAVPGNLPTGDPSPRLRAWFTPPAGVLTLVVAGSLSTS